MPKPHRDLIEAIASGPSIKDYIHSSDSPEALETYNDCLQAMKSFRDSHLKIVTRFIINMTHQKTGTGTSEGATGTGGTDLMSFLKGLRDSTLRAMLRTTREGGGGDSTERVVPMATPPRWLKGDVKRALQVTLVFVAAAAGTLLVIKKFLK
ncbi:indoleamine 2,3-dioxygenase 2-like [Strongylocentrotus purpuratus]|uniref:Uncharacterized protein n=1 Tax=Strongylocentrotus purpuratus TaxID=7668 RepID=A0A7M7T2Y3_STRPU|nr:indoleamine 2,3-dioxygenase 2-like [Strongylocentrotus purpuratus]